MTSVTITEFLLARIAEDEAEIAAGLQIADVVAEVNPGGMLRDGTSYSDSLRAMQKRPQRECEAKRRIVAAFPVPFIADPPAGVQLSPEATVAVAVLRALAAVYADHPDYDRAWMVRASWR